MVKKKENNKIIFMGIELKHKGLIKIQEWLEKNKDASKSNEKKKQPLLWILP